MTAVLIDGAAIARLVYDELRQRWAELGRHGVRPGLAAILVGDNPASEVYVRTKPRACAEVGIHSVQHRFGADCHERELTGLIESLNADPAIHGILVQLPLPPRLDSGRILQAVDARKDVDGFNWCNLGPMVAGHPRFFPCTPLGVMTMLDREKIAVEGRTAGVIGRSGIVGKAMALMV